MANFKFDPNSNYQYWTAILYPENMVDNWESEISNILKLPFCYCIHDKDLLKETGEERKKHVHLILCFKNPTSLNHATHVINSLSKDGFCAIPNGRIEPVIDMLWLYNYLIHDNDDCRKKRKHLYKQEERICGNGFDIGRYIQQSLAERMELMDNLTKLIRDNCVYNYDSIFDLIELNFPKVIDQYNYKCIVYSHSGHFERLTRGIWQRVCYKNRDS